MHSECYITFLALIFRHACGATIFAAASACTSRNCTAAKRASKWANRTQTFDPSLLPYRTRRVTLFCPHWLLFALWRDFALLTKKGNAYVNDVYLNGQNQDVWCRTHKIVDPAVLRDGVTYDSLAGPSCYKFRYLKSTIEQNDNEVCLIENVEVDPNVYIHCICSD
jgi:hypothetical protein